MILLGLNAYHADSSAAILVNGKLIAATEEERFRRIKHWAGFPSKAIEFCLKEAGVTLEQVDHITIGRDPYAKLMKKVLFLMKDPFSGLATVRSRMKNRQQIISLQSEFVNHFGVPEGHIRNKIRSIEHHRLHLLKESRLPRRDWQKKQMPDGSCDARYF